MSLRNTLRNLKKKLSGPNAFPVSEEQTLDPLSVCDTQKFLKNFNSKTSHSVFVIDVDKLGDINNTFGTDFGDYLLSDISKKLHAIFKNKNARIGRVSSHRFIAVINLALNDRQIWEYCIQLSGLFSAHLSLPSINTPIFLQPYIGISTSNDCVGTGLYACYDRAILAVKEARKNKVESALFSDDMLIRYKRRQSIVYSLQNIDVFDEFSLDFQECIPMHEYSKKIKMEVFLRWGSVKLGAVSPREFIAIAEEMNLMGKIDLWVVESTIKHLRNLNCADVQISCNISAQSIVDPDFPRKVRNLLKAYDVNPQQLQIEISERGISADISQSILNLHSIRSGGVSIALDNFCARYSTLSSIRDLPIDTIKIDSSFAALNESKKNIAVVRSVINLARELGISVIIGGIENAEQHELVRQLGVDYGQGFFYSEPAPIEKFFGISLPAKAGANSVALNN